MCLFIQCGMCGEFVYICIQYAAYVYVLVYVHNSVCVYICIQYSVCLFLFKKLAHNSLN